MELDFLQKDYRLIFNFAYLFIVFAIIVFLRYIVLSGIYLRFIYIPLSVKGSKRILSPKIKLSQRNKEIFWSGISSILFGLVGVLMIMAWQYGYTKIYTTTSDYPVWYLLVSFILAALVHETYYYWLHRILHHPKLFRWIHKTHHDSVTTSVWTSFSFHPLESLLQAVVIPIIVIIIPMHIYVLLAFLAFMTISAIINHAGVEIFPSESHKHWLGKYFIGATHHDQHHRKYLFNYGLYFTIWDKWMGTESLDYSEKFEKHTSKN